MTRLAGKLTFWLARVATLLLNGAGVTLLMCRVLSQGPLNFYPLWVALCIAFGPTP